VRPPREKKLPAILSLGEVQRILGAVVLHRFRVCLLVLYSGGLRLGEGVHLRVQDVDSARGVLHIRHGKGGKDRYVPLPQQPLLQLRAFWKTHRNPDTGIHKAVSVHSLRHSWATHLLEAGVNQRVIQGSSSFRVGKG